MERPELPLLPITAEHRALSQSIPRDWSQEVRITSPQDQALRGTLGANYLYIHSPKGGLNGYSVAGAVQNNSVRTKSTTPAVFGAVYWDVMEQITLTADENAALHWTSSSAVGTQEISEAKSRSSKGRRASGMGQPM